MTTADVVICGGGVAGLTLASLLGRRGLRVVLLEKQRTYRMVHKGELIQPRSLEILDELDLLDPMRTDGALPVSALAVRTARGRGLVSLDYRLLTTGVQHGMVQSYQEMLTTIAGRLDPSVDVRPGARAERLLRDNNGRVCGVVVQRDGKTEEIRAAVTVASDGHASRLRDQAGIVVVPHRYDHQLVGFEIDNAPPLGQEMHAHLTPDGLRALFALPGGRARLYVQIPAGSFRGIGRAGLPEWADGVVRRAPALDVVSRQLRDSFGTVQVMSASRFIAPRWTVPGFALLGDAAHSVHPMVGQGMNAAIGDAWELGIQLSAQGSMDTALATYEAVRRPRLEYVARLSHNMATLLTGTSRPLRTVRAGLLRRNQGNVRLRQRITHNMAGLTAQPLNVREWLSATLGVRRNW